MARPQDQRPLSPHLLIYRPQNSSVLSILHRITGVILSFGMILFATWIWAAAYDAQYFALIQDLAGSILGKVALIGWTACFYYHLGNGIRHLNWDMGRGFSLPEMTRSGWLVLIFTASLTIFTWAIVIRKVGF